MKELVGYTGFVGSNLYEKGQFDIVCNSKNVKDTYGLHPDLLVYAGVRAEKYLANNEPEKDLEQIYQAEKNIKEINPRKLILISTIDVIKTPVGIDETATINGDGLQPYGLNRYRLERWVKEHYPDALIIRLPALFGKNIKKNFIYDFISVIPMMLKKEKFQELAVKEPAIRQYYDLQENGFYKCIDLLPKQKQEMKELLLKIDFTALNFTDSRSKFQFYPLARLWDDIQIALKNDLQLWHPATEPVSAAEVYHFLTGKKFVNELNNTPANYDYRTAYGCLFGGTMDYIMLKENVLKSIKEFVEKHTC